MKFDQSKSGIPMIKINDTDYISFGKETKIKNILLSQLDNRGTRRSMKIPVDFKKLPRNAKSTLGPINYRILTELFGMFVKDGTLDANNIKDMENEL